MKTIFLDDTNIKSIRNAERQKTALENKGYSLISTQQVGFDKWVFKYNTVE